MDGELIYKDIEFENTDTLKIFKDCFFSVNNGFDSFSNSPCFMHKDFAEKVIYHLTRYYDNQTIAFLFSIPNIRVLTSYFPNLYSRLDEGKIISSPHYPWWDHFSSADLVSLSNYKYVVLIDKDRNGSRINASTAIAVKKILDKSIVSWFRIL